MRKYAKFLVQIILAIGVSAAQAGAYEDFFRAVDTDRPNVVRDLLARGFDPNTPTEDGQTGLLLAIRAENWQVAQLLAAHPELKVDLANGHGETPLMMAALRGRLDLMRTLLQRGAAVNRDGWTPLHYAASGSEPRAVTLLLDAGARIDAPSPNRTTPLMMAARYGSPDAATLLLARGADPAVRNDRELSASDFARAAGREGLAQRIEAAIPR